MSSAKRLRGDRGQTRLASFHAPQGLAVLGLLLVLQAGCGGGDAAGGPDATADAGTATDATLAPETAADTAPAADTTADAAADTAPAADGGADAAADTGPAVDAAADADGAVDVAPDAGADAADTAAGPPPSPAGSVDPFIGTGAQGFNVGNAFPGACTPYGMVKVSPDTTTTVGRPHVFHCGGYRYEDTHVLGFSHMHLHGTGVPDYGVIRFMAATGPMDDAKATPHGYRSRLDHATEEASPGRYAVTLADPDVRVELTAGPRAAWHRYTFPAGAEGVVLVDLGEVMVNGRVEDAAVTVDAAARTVRGWQHNVGDFSGRYGGFRVYFEARFDRAIDSWGVWDTEGRHAAAVGGAGVPLGAWFAFDTATDADVTVQVGISLVSEANAAANLDADLTGATFDDQVDVAEAAWEAELGRVEIEGTTADERTIFYTALYHVMMMPTLLMDVTDEYVGIDQQVHVADGFSYYTDFSMWDTFRTLHPLVTLIQPEYAADFAQTLTRMAEDGGKMPRWPMGTGYTGSMIGSAADCVIAGTYLKGVTNFDVESAYAALLPATVRDGMDEYLALGYVSTTSSGSVSKTLEYAFEDWCIANLAQALGETEDAARFYARAESYRNLWDSETQFFRPRTPEGDFETPFLPTAFADAYTEATAWQYSWFVPHDVPGLVGLFGSPEAMVEKLDRFFAETASHFNFIVPGFYYYHGNEPSIQAAYMFLEAGRPDLAQKWARWVMATNYRTDPGGIIGNDDAGTLAAWYVFSALGFYPLPGSDRYFVGSPIVDRAVLHLAGGDLVVTVEGGGPDALYVQSVRLNGEPLDVPWFTHGDIVGGGTLDFVMGVDPSDWGVWTP